LVVLLFFFFLSLSLFFFFLRRPSSSLKHFLYSHYLFFLFSGEHGWLWEGAFGILISATA
jgi:hypothetical protein